MPFKRSQLEYFVAVAEEGQMTRASATLHVAQPALSHAIADLEAQLGVELFERHPRGVRLTPAGEAFLEKARVAVEAHRDAARTAQALARATRSVITFGYVGLPPEVTHPALIERLAETHPNIEMSLRELPFPSVPTAGWLSDVDVAICSERTSDPQVWAVRLCEEQRFVLAPRSHPLAEHDALTVADVLDETFIAFAPSVDPTWAGTWSLDDHRGGPPAHVAQSPAATTAERFVFLAGGDAVTIVAACHVEIIAKLAPNLAAMPLLDADPAVLWLVGREDRRNVQIDALREVAQQPAEADPATATPGGESHDRTAHTDSENGHGV